jgi:DNA processing protein
MILRRGSPDYPPLLAQLHDPPSRLHVRGNGAAELTAPAAAVVGARSPSAYGSQWLERWAVSSLPPASSS